MLHSHVGMEYVERDQSSPHPPTQTVCERSIEKSYTPLKYSTLPPNKFAITYVNPLISYVSP